MFRYFTSFLVFLLAIGSFIQSKPICIATAIMVIVLGMSKRTGEVDIPTTFFWMFIPPLIGVVTNQNVVSYGVWKDVFYLIIPVIVLSAGVLCSMLLPMEVFFKLVVAAGVLVSFIIIGMVVKQSSSLADLINPYAARYELTSEGNPVGNPTPVLAAAVLLFAKKFRIRVFPRVVTNVALVICLIGVYMFASRTYFLLLACFLAIWIIEKLSITYLVAITAAAVVLFLFIKPATQTQSEEGFVAKIESSFTEITVGQYDTEEEINTRYRGYESSKALEAFSKTTLTPMLFGDLGRLVDLKLYLNLGGEDMRYIPLFHNGYIFLLLKTGIFGLLVFALTFIFLLIRFIPVYFNKNNTPIARLFAMLIIGSSLGLIITNYVVYSFFNIEMSAILLTIGYVYASYHKLSYAARQQRFATNYLLIPSQQFSSI